MAFLMCFPIFPDADAGVRAIVDNTTTRVPAVDIDEPRISTRFIGAKRCKSISDRE